MTRAIRAAAGRIRRVRSLIDRPADAWLFCRMGTWAAVLPLLKHVLRLDTLARLMWMERPGNAQPDAEKIVGLSRVLGRPAMQGKGTCYERGLLAYRFLSQQGADPRLVIAVKSQGGAITGHAWVTVAGAAIGESEEIEEFVPVVAYGRGGRRESSAGVLDSPPPRAEGGARTP
jgi:hypothetical protein